MLDTGELPCKVLITTSVLDNGFSIEDDNVKNIVICTDDKTEFLQELGRKRINKDKGETVNLYIRVVTKESHKLRKYAFKQYNSLFESLYSGLHTPASKYIHGDIAQTVSRLWSSSDNYCRGVIKLVETSDGKTVPIINEMARWKTIVLEEQLANYDKLYAEYGENAAVIYKTDWLGIDRKKALNIYHHRNEELSLLIAFLEKQVKKRQLLVKGSKPFEKFSRELFKKYHAAFPEDKVNTGSKREPWGAEAINNHLKKVASCPQVDKIYRLVKYTDSETNEESYLLKSEDK